MGNVPSRSAEGLPTTDPTTYHRNDNSQADRPNSLFLSILHQLAHRNSPAPSGPTTSAPGSVEDTTSPAPSTASGTGFRYNLRRTVTRIRREQQQPPRRRPVSNNLEVSRNNSQTASINSGSGPQPVTAATPTNTSPAMLSQQQNNSSSIFGPQASPVDRRRTRPEAEDNSEEARARRPRIADSNLFGRLNFGLDAANDEQSIYFTFPWRGSDDGPRHVVLVRVRHMLDVAAGQAREGADDGINGILQWTLFFLMPQTASMEDLSQPPPNVAFDPAQVLTEAFAAFNTLISDTAMSYEELTRLQEMMGFVSRGVDQDNITRSLSTTLYVDGMETGGPNCSICLCPYQDKESCRRLPCSHFYHTGCIDKWLNQVNQCPLCRKEAVSKKKSAEVPPAPSAAPAAGPTFIIPPEDLD